MISAERLGLTLAQQLGIAQVRLENFDIQPECVKLVPESLARRYNAFFRKVEMPGSAMAYTIDHSSVIYVIDKQGKVQTQVQHAAPPAELAAAIRAWL